MGESAPQPGLAAAFDRLFPVRAEPGEGIDGDMIERAERVLRPLRHYFRTEHEGLENLPTGGALLVSNHGPMGWDSLELVLGIYRETGRVARGLAEKTIFRFAPFKMLVERLGAVAGTRDNAVRLLGEGELVLVYPGGAREALKGAQQRYQLAWDKARGFVRVALAASVPIVPVAGIGVDDYYKIMGEPEEVADTLLGKTIQGILGHEKYIPPKLLGLGPLPLPAKLRFVFGAPMSWPDLDADAASDPAVVERIRREVKDRLEQMILTGLIRRDHPVWG